MFSRLALFAIFACAAVWISLSAIALGSFSSPGDQPVSASPLPGLALFVLVGLLLWRWQPGRTKS
jgi:MYXO-CTERM domain-containing protein